MDDSAKTTARPIARVVQWAAFALLAFFTLIWSLMPIRMMLAGVSTTPYWIAVVAFATITIALIPPIFFKFSQRVKIATYLALIPAFIGILGTYIVVDAAYLKTPEGKAEAEATAAAEASESRAAQEAEDRQSTEATFKRIEEDASEMRRGVERCINWRGQIPSLVTATKEALHNPRSFEHIRTEVSTIGATPSVVMEYRAENGFGAIRTASVNAFISPEDCSVIAAQSSGAN